MGTDVRPLLTPPKSLPIQADSVDADTMCGIVLRQVERFGPRLSVTIKRDERWLPVSWAELQASTVAVGAALIHQDVAAGDRIAILSENRLEWMYIDFGGQASGAIVVPIYASSTADTVAQILGDSGAVVTG